MKVQSLKYKIKEGKGGFALLIAVVVSTIIIAIGVSIVNSILKEILLASTIRNSLASFYVADGGVECGLYWDNVRGNFSVKSAFVPSVLPSQIECAGKTIEVEATEPVSFWIEDKDKQSAVCTHVTLETVTDELNPDSDNIILESFGYNSCDPNNPRRVDRALRVKYSRNK